MKYFLVITALALMFLGVMGGAVFAQDYQLLQSLPLDGAERTSVTPTQYIEGMFMLIIGIAGVLAVIMIIVGGIKYMTTDAVGGKSDAKKTIQNAIFGLLLALGAWIILYSIDERLVNFNINIEPVPIEAVGPSAGSGGGRLPGYSLTPGQVAEDSAIRQALLQHNPPILVPNPPCVNGETSGCTNVVGMPDRALSVMRDITTSCHCSITVTGGTEGGHQTHGPGLPVFDLRSSDTTLNNYLLGTRALTPGVQVTRGDTTFTYETNPPHWHVSVR